MLRLGIQSTSPDCIRHSVQRQHISRRSIIYAVLSSISGNISEAGYHDLLEAFINQIFIPEVSLPILHPFEVRNGDAAGVRQNVRNDKDLFLSQDRVRGARGGAISALA